MIGYRFCVTDWELFELSELLEAYILSDEHHMMFIDENIMMFIMNIMMFIGIIHHQNQDHHPIIQKMLVNSCVSVCKYSSTRWLIINCCGGINHYIIIVCEFTVLGRNIIFISGVLWFCSSTCYYYCWCYLPVFNGIPFRRWTCKLWYEGCLRCWWFCQTWVAVRLFTALLNFQ